MGGQTGEVNVQVPITGGAAAPSYAASSATADVSAPFEESAFDVGGYQIAYPGAPLDSTASTTQTSADASTLPSWMLYAGAAFFAWFMLRHHGAAA